MLTFMILLFILLPELSSGAISFDSQERPEFHLLLKIDEAKYTFPTIRHSATERDLRHETQFKLSELSIIRRFIPSAVFKHIECGSLAQINEMRTISTVFVSGSGVDVSTDEGAQIAQDLMSTVQRICYSYEAFSTRSMARIMESTEPPRNRQHHLEVRMRA